jgi:hypothetical protein
MAPSKGAPGPHFTDIELDQVEDDLILAVEDVHWKSDELYVLPSFFRGKLKERGHTLARIEATLARLVERAVFELRDFESKHVVEIEFKRYFTTRERWFGYLADRQKTVVVAPTQEATAQGNAYNPRARQPQTLGELERWFYANEAFMRATMIPPPIALNPPPIPGLDRLAAYCAARYGQKLSVETVARLIGEYALAHDVSTDEAKAALLQNVAATLASKTAAPTPPPSPPPAACGPTFTSGDLRRAVDALDLVFQDEEPPAEESKIRQNELIEQLKQHGITRGLALALIERLITEGVLQAGEEFVDIQTTVRFDGQQSSHITPNRFLLITRDRWYTYLAKERSRCVTPRPSQSDAQPDSGPPLPSDPGAVVIQEIQRINRLHRLAVRCVNAVLTIQHLHDFADGDRLAPAALIELRNAVDELPELPLNEDPFCGDNLVEEAGLTATSTHVAAFLIVQRAWQESHLTQLEWQDATNHQNEDGTPFTRVTQEVVRRMPTEVEWSVEEWRRIIDQLSKYPSLDHERLQAALVLERNRATRRLEGRFGVIVTGNRTFAAQPVVENVQPAVSTDRASSAPPGGGAVSQFVLRLNVGVWLIQFGKESGQIPADGNKGMKHLAEILRHPFRPLTGMELNGGGSQAPQGECTFQPVSDDPALEDYRKTADDLTDRIETARRNNDLATLESLQNELSKLVEEIQSSTGLGRRKRRLGSKPQEEKSFKAAGRAIDRCLKKLRSAMSNFVSNLEKTIIRNSRTFIYVPAYDPTNPNPNWQF